MEGVSTKGTRLAGGEGGSGGDAQGERSWTVAEIARDPGSYTTKGVQGRASLQTTRQTRPEAMRRTQMTRARRGLLLDVLGR